MLRLIVRQTGLSKTELKGRTTSRELA